MKRITKTPFPLPGMGLVLALMFLGALSALGVAEELTVVKGASTRLPVAEGVKKIAVEKPAILDARPAEDGKAVLLNALAEGSSELRIERVQGTDLLYRVLVRADLQKMIAEIKELLSEVEGVEIKDVGSKIWLKGKIATKSGFDTVTKVAEAYGNAVVNSTKLDRSTTGDILCRLILDDIGIETVTARLVEDTVILEGVVYSKGDADRAVQLAQGRNPKILNLLAVQQVLIETDAQYIQVDTEDGSNFGHNVLDSLDIQARGGLGGGNTGKPTLSYGVTASANAKIKALLSSGHGKILNEQNVTVNSGEEGQTQVGGTSYITVAGNVGGSVEKIPFGVMLKVKPVLEGKDQVLLNVSVEVSSPIVAGEGNFAQQKSQTQTTVRCGIGESVFLSGLVQVLGNRTKTKTPLLGDITLVNLFFSEKVSSKTKKEVLLVLTPHVHFPEPSNTPAQSTRMRQLSDGTVVGGAK
jgi:Flp pilus assembly secretin CpaC